MAAGKTDEGSVTVELSSELDEWLDKQSNSQGESRETIVRQLLAAHRTATDPDNQDSLGSMLDIEGMVEDALKDQLKPIEQDFQNKISDVRERFLQTKRKIDQKAPADHEAFQTVNELEIRLEELSSTVENIQEQIEEGELGKESLSDSDLESLETELSRFDTRMEDAEDKLNRVAWVIKDIRESQLGKDREDLQQQTVNSIKRTAAEAGISSAPCNGCDTSVDIGLLTEPLCPHCDMRLGDLRETDGMLRTKRVLVGPSNPELNPGTDE
jgi:negative regulator of replication initiation